MVDATVNVVKGLAVHLQMLTVHSKGAQLSAGDRLKLQLSAHLYYAQRIQFCSLHMALPFQLRTFRQGNACSLVVQGTAQLLSLGF